jgi:cytidine deaminase
VAFAGLLIFEVYMQDKIIDKMFKAALKARENAHAPYSKFYVGASVLSEDGEIFAGCNVENAAYGGTICAEANAICSLVAAGKKKIKAALVVGDAKTLITPCGACRQKIREFARLDVPVYLADLQGVKKTVTLEELLPYSFGPEHL